MIKLIVAYAKSNRVIGKDGKLPWHLPEDMKHFKETTGHEPVVMGRKTYDSLPEKFKPLPGRQNTIISRTKKSDQLFFSPTAPQYASSVERAIEVNDLTSPGQNIWIIGGGEIYNHCLENDLVDEIWATEVDGDFEGDTFFPELEGWTGKTVKSFDNFNIVKYTKD